MLAILFLSDARAENDIGALIDEGISLYRQRRYIEARAALEKGVLSTKEPDLYYLLGNTYFMLEQTAKSEEAYRAALKLDPEYMPALQNLGRLLYKEKKYKESIALFDRVLAKDGQDVEAIRFQAGCYHALNETSMAVQKFLEVHHLEPDDSQTIRTLARLYRDSWEYSKAIPFYEKLIAIEPAQPGHYLSLSMAHYKLGEKQQALNILQKGHKHLPDDYDIASRLGDVLFANKDYSQAVNIYKKALLINPQSKEVPLYLAKIYYLQKNFAEGEKILKDLLKRDSSNLQAYEHLAPVYLSQNKLKEAATSYKKALKIDPENEEAKQGLLYALKRDIKGVRANIDALSGASPPARRRGDTGVFTQD